MAPAAFSTQEHVGSFHISLQDGEVDFKPMDDEFERPSAKASLLR